MSEASRRIFSLDEFLRWEDRQDRRFVSQSERRVLVWRRDSAGRLVPEAAVSDGALDLPLEGEPVRLALNDIYEGTELPHAAASARA